MSRVRAQLEHAEGQLREVQRRLLARKTAIGDRIAEEKLLMIDPKFRLDWMTRLGAIVRSGAVLDGPTATSNLGHSSSETALQRERESARHQELQALLSDFQRCATSYSKLIVQEFFLPESQKLIRAAERRKTDTGLGYKSTFEVHHIRFVVQLDYDGIYDGDHTNAMKCGGNALRASKTLFVSNLPGVMVPLQACVDYAGFRVLATVCEVRTCRIARGAAVCTPARISGSCECFVFRRSHLSLLLKKVPPLEIPSKQQSGLCTEPQTVAFMYDCNEMSRHCDSNLLLAHFACFICPHVLGIDGQRYVARIWSHN